MNADPGRPYHVFFSYAHRHDGTGIIPSFFERLKAVHAHFCPSEPWWAFFDRPAIRQGDDWAEILRQAASTCGVMLAFMSPAYFQSDWCRREWEAFRRQEETRGGLRLFPVYLETDPDFELSAPPNEWHRDLKRRQFLDIRAWDVPAIAGDPVIRAQFDRLVWDINVKLVELASGPRPYLAFGVPRLPQTFVPRPDDLDRVKRHLLRGDIGTLVISAVLGLPGVGKSTLAAALAWDPEVRRHFPDGILWTTLGVQPNIRAELGNWIRALGDESPRPLEPVDATSHLNGLLQDRRMLLVVDDAWSADAARWFQVGGAGCRVLITTRERRNIPLSADHLDLDVMSEDEALALFARFVGQLADEAPAARAVAREVGCLPLALGLAAGRVKARKTTWPGLLRDLRDEIRGLEVLRDPEVRSSSNEDERKKLSVTASVRLSLRDLPADVLTDFAWLGVFPDDVVFHEAVGAVLWPSDEFTAGETLELLFARSLLTLHAPATEGRPAAYRLHDVLHEAARQLLKAPVQPTTTQNLPGLGLPWAEAQREFLRRYATRTQGGKWHTLPDDGYIYPQLGWHLEQAGQTDQLHALIWEEDDEGRNGWHAACDRVDRLGVFFADVERAWRQAEEAGSAARQLRCALLAATLSSLAEKLPPGLLAGLVQAGLWSAEQALVYARRVRTAWDCARAVAALIPFVPAAQGEVLAAETLDAVIAGKKFENAWETFADVVPRLPDSFLARVLEMAAGVRNELIRAQVLAAVAARLPEPQRTATFEQALQAVGEFEEGGVSDPWPTIAAGLPAALLPRALKMVVEMKYACQRSPALAALARRVPVAQGLVMLRAIEDPDYRPAALAAVAVGSPEPERTRLFQQALQAVAEIDNEFQSSRALIAIAPSLPPDLLTQAWSRLGEIEQLPHRTQAAAALAVLLPEPQRTRCLWETLAMATRCEDAHQRALTLVAIAQRLPEPRRTRTLEYALEAALAVRRPEDRTRALVAVAPHVPEPGHTNALREALTAARAIQRVRDRAGALATLAPLLPPAERTQALREALEAAGADESPGDPEPLAAITPLLPAELLSRLLEVIAGFAGSHRGCHALRAAVPHLPAELLPEVLELAARMEDRDRDYALIVIAPRLPAPQALEIAAGLKDPGHRARALAEVAVGLPEPERSHTFKRSLQAATEGMKVDHPGVPLAGIAPLLPPELLPEVLELVAGRKDSRIRGATLLAVAPRLPAEYLPQALELVEGIKDPRMRSQCLGTLVPRLPVAQALAIVATIPDLSWRRRTLLDLATRVPEEQRDPLLEQAFQLPDEGDHVPSGGLLTASAEHGSIGARPRLSGNALRVLAPRGRTALFSNLVAFIPILDTLGGPTLLDEMVEDIQTVCRWWP
jgi:hypothetical protein